MEKFGFGMIGLGTMGSNLVLNMSDNGFSVAGYDKNTLQVNNLNELSADRKVRAFDTIEEFVSSLAVPRIIMLLVPAGPIVDAVVFELKPMLGESDLIIDCGNSHFPDTQKRTESLLKEGLHFMGLGISGGETGARYGASIMPGGDKSAYERIRPMLDAIAAKVNGLPCVAYMGAGAAGHYVKMVQPQVGSALSIIRGALLIFLTTKVAIEGLSNFIFPRSIVSWVNFATSSGFWANKEVDIANKEREIRNFFIIKCFFNF